MDAVLSYLKRNEGRFLARLREYLRFQSISAQSEHRADVRRCAAWLARHCREIGLETEMHATAGHPIVLARTPRRPGAKRPHYLVYGHYDVQPPEPFELWDSPPFEPAIRRGRIFARGATDNKGQHLAHLNAVEAYLKTGTDLLCDLTFLIEGEEEVGSANVGPFLRKHREALRCQAAVISDSGMPSLKQPALTYGLRGGIGMEIVLRGPARDLHSGTFGGAIDNPAMVLCQMLASLRDAKGRIRVPGFYEQVAPLSPSERRRLAGGSFSGRELQKLAGVPRLFGEAGYTPGEQCSARPTLEINGLTGGYQGEGGKTIIPAWARAKITCRLVPNQTPERIRSLVIRHLERICPRTVEMQITPRRGGSGPYLMSPESAEAQAALRALRASFGRAPVLIREGGSIPIVSQFKSILNMDTLLVGFGLPDDRAHSPNENLSLAAYRLGSRFCARLWPELAALGKRR